MYQLPELAKAICDDERRAAEHHRLSAPAYAARRNGTRRGIVPVAKTPSMTSSEPVFGVITPPRDSMCEGCRPEL